MRFKKKEKKKLKTDKGNVEQFREECEASEAWHRGSRGNINKWQTIKRNTSYFKMRLCKLAVKLYALRYALCRPALHLVSLSYPSSFSVEEK